MSGESGENGRRRIGCVWLPRFGLTVASRLDPLKTHRSSPFTLHSPLSCVALYRPGTRWQELLECSPDLEAIGIRPGMPLKEAQSRSPEARYLPCDEAALAAIARAFEAVVDALDAFSPIVEPAPLEALGSGRAVAYLDVAGLQPLYGPEPRLAERLAAAATSATADLGGCLARVGIAASKFTAWVAATLADSMVVPPGEEALFLAPLPLETLPLPLQARLALQRLGVRTLGDYARLPANAVVHRYGGAGRHAHLLAQGNDDEPLRPRRPQLAARVEIAFDWEETELDRLVFALKMLADQLAARLAALDQWAAGSGQWAVEALRVIWRLSGGEEREALLRLAEPACSAAVFTEHLRWHAEGLDRLLARDQGPGAGEELPLPLGEGRGEGSAAPPLPSWERGLGGEGSAQLSANELAYEPIEQRLGVIGIALEAVGVQVPGGTQLKLLASPLQWGGDGMGAVARLDPVTRAQQARRAIARFQARWGPEAVWQASLTQSRLPEQAFISAPPSIELQIDPAATSGPSPFISHIPFWLVDPPQEVRVLRPRQKGGRAVLSFGAVAPLTPHPPLPQGERGSGVTDTTDAIAPPIPLWGRGFPQVRGGMVAAQPSRKKGLRIVKFGGPWRLVDPTHLTTGEPLRRDYYHVETEDGRAYLVFWDRVADTWFLQGVFD
ncbi:MAG: hypothetical protein HY332_07145 [Chloroflexi bacterium]|nr:hypothetical protein [Chloroflexota bacterium]